MARRDAPEPRVPDVNDGPRQATGEVAPPAEKAWFRDLDEAVIEAGRCVQCASCVAACPSDSIGIADADDRPTLVKMCTGCSRCWDNCPRAGLRYERLWTLATEPETAGSDGLGALQASYAARAGRPAEGHQHGGVVTALLSALLERGDLDGAVVAAEDPERPGRATPRLVTTPAGVSESAGSLFTQPLSLAALDDLLAGAVLPDDPSLALVGTPCVIGGVTALEHSPYRSGEFDESRPLDAIDLTIGLLCTQAFDHERLGQVLDAEYGLGLDEITSMDVVGDGVRIEAGDRTERASLAALSEAVLDGCLECADLTGRTADLSVGTIGSGRDRSTVLVRTERGVDAWERVGDAIDAEPLADPGPVAQLSSWNRERAEAALQRSFDPEAERWIGYAAHREAYDGTDRAPAELNPARVHQYEEWC